MATEQEKIKTLEMRVAELEEKLAKPQISEEELKTFQKVATTLGTAGPAALANIPAASIPYWIWYQYHIYYWVYYWYQQTPGQAGQLPNLPPFAGLGGPRQ
jgi:hypothetical protein